jgi:hypothetical protein
MVQTSDKSSRKTYVETRGGITYYHTDEPQTEKGWYWCYEKKGLFRYTDWNISVDKMKEKYC